jgi:hypothetical protein
VDDSPESHEHRAEDGKRSFQGSFTACPAFRDGTTDVRNVLDTAPEGVGSGVDDRADMSVDERAASEQAWFEGGVETMILVAVTGGQLSKDIDFGVCDSGPGELSGWSCRLLAAVAPTRDHTAACIDQDGSYRSTAGPECFPGQLECHSPGLRQIGGFRF